MCVCVCVYALFSPEILQAGAMKGLTSHQLTSQKLDHSSGQQHNQQQMQQREKQSTRSTPLLDLPVYVRGGEARTAGHSSHIGIAALSVTVNTRKGITNINIQLNV